MALSLDDYMTVPSVAEYADCSIATIRYRISKGQLKPTEIVRSGAGFPVLLLFSPETVRDHLEERPIKVIGRRLNRA
jgi:hypothetical protein